MHPPAARPGPEPVNRHRAKAPAHRHPRCVVQALRPRLSSQPRLHPSGWDCSGDGASGYRPFAVSLHRARQLDQLRQSMPDRLGKSYRGPAHLPWQQRLFVPPVLLPLGHRLSPVGPLCAAPSPPLHRPCWPLSHWASLPAIGAGFQTNCPATPQRGSI